MTTWHKGGTRAQVQARKRLLARTSVCALCGGYVDKTLKWPHPMSPSLDHITPRSRGGALLDPKNHQLAHLSCNSSRGNGTRRDEPPTSRQW